ncbi:unnamed protein product [Rotaria magnacalcarata]|uniref:Uncharacterized protein n=2 Tax=Rotaria magnacalcarata TaxID=392030 RepID=A0A815R849_9BILA|nr:unnamed protein product [Rotaria magnacalcarata]CAF1473478.1 unnamed protein product [Rotaria magnacalcarata]CAF4076224.1 unnamed protein product [Rotaria magnacalcarata]CAF4115774.1 unnamed protein product [Rotaria magnacalcarata]
MAFYGPTFPNETHYETLASARQRFGNRSANMFFVRPARHVACPRRLKYMHDITTGYVPYVEDSNYVNQPSYRYVIDKGNNDNINKNNSFGFHNSVDAWRQQLIELAQQVNSSLISTGEQEPIIRSLRSSRISRHCSKRNAAPTNGNADDSDEQGISKRLLNRNLSTRYPTSKVNKPQVDEKPEQEETTTQEENQDSGIWLIPILCYILKIDNVVDAQDWLVNANPTEKRLAKELISRTMQDIKNHEIDVISDISNSDQSTTTSLNNVYWPYKIWQRQEKDRHQQHQQQQQQIQQVVKQSKLSSGTSLPSLTNDNSETCERATSPLRILTPARRLSTTTNSHHISVESLVIERPITRIVVDRTASAITARDNLSQITDRAPTIQARPFSTSPSFKLTNGHTRPSRRGYRVATSLNHCTDSFTNQISPTSRGKTPLV